MALRLLDRIWNIQTYGQKTEETIPRLVQI